MHLSCSKKRWLHTRKIRILQINKTGLNRFTLFLLLSCTDCCLLTFNNYFSTIGETLAKNIEKHHILSYTYFLKNRIFSSFFCPSSVAEVYTELCSLKSKKIYSPDDIPSYFAKLAASIISPYLTYFIEKSFKSEIFPNSLKVAKVLPIFKKGSNTAPENF